MAIRLLFFDASHIPKPIKASISKSGKLVFSLDAVSMLSLAAGKSISIARNKKNPDDDSLYIIVTNQGAKSDFAIKKTGKTYYANTKALFDNLGIDYQLMNVWFIISKMEGPIERLYVLKKYESPRVLGDI